MSGEVGISIMPIFAGEDIKSFAQGTQLQEEELGFEPRYLDLQYRCVDHNDML